MFQKRLDRIPVPAVVVGLNAGGLGVVRSLSAHGVPVIAIDDSLDKPEMATRAAARKAVLPIFTSELIDGLLRLARQLPERPVLIATMRLPLLIISEYRERLCDAFRLVLPDHDVVVSMENKDRLMSAASAAGMLLPRTLMLDCDAALAEAQQMRYPVILKPADNDLAYMARFKKAYILHDHMALRDLVALIWPHYRALVLQEWISGGDEELYFCLQYRNQEGRPLASFVGRKLLSWPPGTGATAACTAATSHQEQVERLTNDLFDAVGACGFGGVEFKRDSVSGDFYLIEPTVGRTDQQEEVATINGINIPFAAYCDQTGAPMPLMMATSVSNTWSNPLSVRWAVQQLRAEERAVPRLRIGRGRVFDAYFRRQDPLPGLLNLLQVAPAPVVQLLQRVRRRLRAGSAE